MNIKECKSQNKCMVALAKQNTEFAFEDPPSFLCPSIYSCCLASLSI